MRLVPWLGFWVVGAVAGVGCVGEAPDVSDPPLVDGGSSQAPTDGGTSATGDAAAPPTDATPPPADATPPPLDATPPPADASPDASPDATVPFGVLTTDQERLDFGVVDVGETATRAVKVTNTGSVPLAAPTIGATPAVFSVTANGCMANLGIGAECLVEVTFRPDAFGVVSGSLTFSDASGPIKQVLLAATGRATHVLSVAKNGTGSGLVRAEDASIALSCGADCAEAITSERTAREVTLVAEPAADSSFAGWNGCTGTGPTCVVTVDAAKTVTASFTRDKRVLRVEYVADQPDVGGFSSSIGAAPGPAACAGACTQDFYVADDAELTIVPPASASYRFTDACAAVNGQPCVVRMTSDQTVKLRASKYNYAFVTSATYDGNLGGLAGADQKCNDAAAGGGLPGTFRAYVSLEGVVAARDRMTRAGGFIRTDKLIFARNAAELKQARYRSPLWLDESGASRSGLVSTDGERVWTGTSSSGTPQAGFHCDGWASTSAQGLFGGTRGQRHRLLNQNVGACTLQSRLYCLGDDLDAEVPLPGVPLNARRAFVTSTAHPANLAVAPEGMGAYDAICQARASAAGLGNHTEFAALLPSATQSPVARLGLTEDAPWVGIDGVPLAATASAFLDGAYTAGLQLTETGGFLADYENTFTGYPFASPPLTPRSPVNDAFTCNGWTSAAATDNVGVGYSSDVSRSMWTAFYSTLRTCNRSSAFYCVERTVRP